MYTTYQFFKFVIVSVNLGKSGARKAMITIFMTSLPLNEAIANVYAQQKYSSVTNRGPRIIYLPGHMTVKVLLFFKPAACTNARHNASTVLGLYLLDIYPQIEQLVYCLD